MSDEKPTFDYSGFSRKAQRALVMRQLRVRRLGAQLDAHGVDMPDDEFEQKAEELNTMSYELERAALARVSTVPSDWFVPDAPKGLTCADDSWWDWLRADKVEALIEAAADAKSPEAVSGN